MMNPIWRGRFAIADVLIPLRQNDGVLAIIDAALVLRQSAPSREQSLHFVTNGWHKSR